METPNCSHSVITGPAADVLATLEDGVLQTTVTSPPYFGHRKYDTDHPAEIGVEGSLGDYISNLVGVFEKLRLKTADSGTLWLNLGDTYRNGQLLGVPWRVALALVDVGWRLRSDVIWHKPNAMPSSVKNRPTVDHEYVFLFAKNDSYFYDADSIREPHVTLSPTSKMRGGRNHLGKRGSTPEAGKNAGNSNLHDARWDQAFHPKGRNRRTVWNIPLGKNREAHFAVFPEKLVETCLLATSAPGDLVGDPFTGSGTTGIIAKQLGRGFLGAEISEKYGEMARRRIAAVNDNLLF